MSDSANSENIAQVFASLNLGAVLSEETDTDGLKPLSWMLPSQVDYCIANVVDGTTGQVDLDKSCIACMAMAEEHHSTNWNSVQVDETILSRLASTTDTALVISRRMFVEHFLLPVVKTFPQNKDHVLWQFTNTGDTIENQNTVHLGYLPDENGNGAAATVGPNKFTFGVRNNEIHMEIQDITWKWSDDYECVASYRVSYQLELDKTDPSSPKLRVKPGSVDKCSVSVNEAGSSSEAGRIATDIAVAAVGAVVGAVLGNVIGSVLGKVLTRIAASGAEEAAEVTVNLAEDTLEVAGSESSLSSADSLLSESEYSMPSEGETPSWWEESRDDWDGETWNKERNYWSNEQDAFKTKYGSDYTKYSQKVLRREYFLKEMATNATDHFEETIEEVERRALEEFPYTSQEKFALYVSKMATELAEGATATAGKAGDLIELCFGSKARFLGGLIGALAGGAPGTIMAAAEYSAAELKGDLGGLPDFTPTVQIGLGSVKWPTASAGAEGFVLDEVILDGALILGGRIVEGT
ncbi:MAG: P-47 protein [Candidatus Kentron sp. G]|nr:MAG: P-47 protein [Candidatus Kentron sp. G]VFN04881.1 MAG: P-47 protein [Candidatus Kentron sp. G]VFN06020.1 MAG: P-47 protein [Candidatus Kentron sp. G]